MTAPTRIAPATTWATPRTCIIDALLTVDGLIAAAEADMVSLFSRDPRFEAAWDLSVELQTARDTLHGTLERYRQEVIDAAYVAMPDPGAGDAAWDRCERANAVFEAALPTVDAVIADRRDALAVMDAAVWAGGRVADMRGVA